MYNAFGMPLGRRLLPVQSYQSWVSLSSVGISIILNVLGDSPEKMGCHEIRDGPAACQLGVKKEAILEILLKFKTKNHDITEFN